MPMFKPTPNTPTLSQDLMFLNGKTITWDVFRALHATLGTQAVADQVWCRSPKPVHEVTTSYLDYIIGMLALENISGSGSGLGFRLYLGLGLGFRLRL
jgi:hypothetical protein